MKLMGIEHPYMNEDEFFEKVKAETDGQATRNLVREAVRFKRVCPTRVGRRNLFSDQDVIDLLRALKAKPTA